MYEPDGFLWHLLLVWRILEILPSPTLKPNHLSQGNSNTHPLSVFTVIWQSNRETGEQVWGYGARGMSVPFKRRRFVWLTVHSLLVHGNVPFVDIKNGRVGCVRTPWSCHLPDLQPIRIVDHSLLMHKIILFEGVGKSFKESFNHSALRAVPHGRHFRYGQKIRNLGSEECVEFPTTHVITICFLQDLILGRNYSISRV